MWEKYVIYFLSSRKYMCLIKCVNFHTTGVKYQNKSDLSETFKYIYLHCFYYIIQQYKDMILSLYTLLISFKFKHIVYVKF